MLTQPFVSFAADRDPSINDILAMLDEIERWLHDAMTLTETGLRVCQQELAASATLRSQIVSDVPDMHINTRSKLLQRSCARLTMPVNAGANDEGASAVLTPRERQVLDLIAGGLSNRRIAEVLSLSPRTVERHIANLYLKLDVHTKAEATAWALVHGLVVREAVSNGSVTGLTNGWQPENYIDRLHSSTDA